MESILFVDNSTRCFCIFRLSVAKAFIRLGYDVYIMAPDSEGEYVERIKQTGANYIPYRISPNFSPLSDVCLFALFYRQYKRIKPDYIIHYTIKPNIYGTLAARLRHCPSLSVVPGTGSVFQNKGFVSKIVLLLYKFAFRFPEKIWVLNKDDYKAFISKKIVSSNRISILPGEGVDVEYYTPLEKKQDRHSPFVFLYMGRMLREKGVEYIAMASALLRERGLEKFEIQLLGLIDGLSKDVISEIEIKEWEQKKLVRFLGGVSDVRDYIAAADCILLPTFYGEGVPRSLMEACAMERIVLATDNVGCRDVVQNGYNGVLCRIKDTVDLADKMEQIMQLPEAELKQFGKNGRLKVLSEFQDTVIIERYLKEII